MEAGKTNRRLRYKTIKMGSRRGRQGSIAQTTSST